ncbi:isochorismatase family protein [Prochlorococcus marinus]|uniref:isochorismatase family protein n=1 Tax=Prochlorococcus marinus TaxID=1219 RepID=UPI0022B5211B|nr:isochorismatase family protein [Prochlorococcus marinus]
MFSKRIRKAFQILINEKSFPINEQNTALVVIDMQEKLLNALPNDKELTWNIGKLISASEIFKLRIFITEQNPSKLGKTISNISPKGKYKKYSKMAFSCINCIDLMKDLKNAKIKNIILCGIETHICISQSALDLLYKGYNIHLIADATNSRGLYDKELAMARMQHHGVTISTTESIIFEICQSADKKVFKEISQLIKMKMKI